MPRSKRRVREHANDNHALSGPNPLQPDQMTTAERMSELGTILAAGILRLRARASAASQRGLYSSHEESVSAALCEGESQ